MRVPHFVLKDYRCLLLRRDRNLRKEQPVLSAQFALSVLFSLQETPHPATRAERGSNVRAIAPTVAFVIFLSFCSWRKNALKR